MADTDYSSDIPPSLLPDYQRLIRQGLPPVVAASILSKPSYAEGQRPHTTSPWTPTTPYQGQQVDPISPRSGQVPNYDALNRQMWNSLTTRQQNLPTWEGHTPGDDDSLGFTRLPSGQYVPQYQQQGANMPWPNLTPQELAAYQMLSQNPQMNLGAQGAMNPQMLAYMQMMQQPQGQQTNPAMQQPTMANMLAAPPTGGIAPGAMPSSAGWRPPTGNMSTIFNNPQLMQLLMQQYGGGAGM